MSSNKERIEKQTNTLIKKRYLNECQRVNQIMTWLMVAQWIAGIAFASFYSPLTWIGQSYEVHVHIWAAILLGGSISGIAILCTRLYPDAAFTRHVIAISQMLWSALLIHLSGGRIETHFHVFASLAILSIYRDWKILITAAVVVAIDHFVRGVFYPLSAFGIIAESPFRWVEHSAWVVFEIAFLVPGCIRLRSELRELCVRQTEIELAKASVDIQVEERTKELASKAQLIEESLNEIYIFDADTFKFKYINRAGRDNLGYDVHEFMQLTPLDIKPDYEPDSFNQIVEPLKTGANQQIVFRTTHVRKNNTCYNVEVSLQHSHYEGQLVFLAIVLDVTDRVQAEKMNANLQNELVDASRLAGMAEVATGVIHNVGNILNSVNVSASAIRNQFQKSAFENLKKISSLISEHENSFAEFIKDDRRGQKIPAYIAEITNVMKSERGIIDEELQDLISNIDHIKQIVTIQQSASKSTGLLQELSPATLIADAITANKGTLINHRVKISTEVGENIPTLISDKHKILQILVNLIKNAKDALVEQKAKNPQIKITVGASLGNIVFDVIDNGIGIPEDKIDKIFQHGFTTKKSGHGFGLHSSANAATELAGNLSVSSQGAGRGAEFKLRLPVQTAEPTKPNLTTIGN